MLHVLPVTRELRDILEVKRWPHVWVFPAKTTTCSCLFAARVENEPQEVPCYAATEKM